MAVMRNSIIFGGVDSADYGIYIGGEGTFNAPKRDVEMISIPGRNGAFALDKGRFENIEVTYSAFNYEIDLATFAQNLSDFRNAICSQKGYQRLTDTFHTDEYRMAAYISGLEIKPIEFNTASTFDIVFDCKPQRYLTSGEAAVTVTNGQTITNPTLFDASPLLEVTGYGNINLNDNVITINNIAIGEVQVLPRTSKLISSDSTTATFTIPAFDDTLLNSGDAVTLSGVKVEAWVNETKTGYTLQSASVTSTTNADGICGEKGKRYTLQMPLISFVYGTSGTYTASMTCTVTWKHSGSTSSGTASLAAQIDYDGSNGVTVITTFTPVTPLKEYYYRRLTIEEIIGNSSTPAIADRVTYIDLDIGEAWGEIDGAIVSMNNAVQLPAELPALVSGENNILFDNTVTLLTITPRWWKV